MTKIILLFALVFAPGQEPEVAVVPTQSVEQCRAYGDQIQSNARLEGLDVRYTCIDVDTLR